MQYIEACPNWEVAVERVHVAMTRLGVTATDLTYEVIDTPEQAEATGFVGSPTILLNGRDPFAQPTASVGLSCRLFMTPDGLAGSPTVDQLMHAIESTMPAPSTRGA